ncbi:tetratricopeptide repeat protein [Sulfitobacter sp. M57]|uniref:tetratricopeptide repeat protein n=1 Tax=unclassified Sulfitobacter TaxID=196795 RepID=UPI0023E15A43|nr:MULTISPECIES: tetratricopeptide repeat protein [unclassified Sulfitobacter]MDF3413179.1 tetratricopeptide repeat protein [Sulfitobacter sp. KE5]MDF3421538.1 tetratricopeptide repeat protein [Sulfitobacter sp. KE43]MDF3431728.1 tetratricopeptide repeat protein [Sulfitobacter sp. KE42]MDF3457369.1 tetratricopeptide repeat protein [Sulfitobacter sp. S74]MDF3461271.1 tetratricopeptide repeat protein [Sulfitobacter sp. Ks18]
MRNLPVNLKRHLAALGATVLLCSTVSAGSATPEQMDRLKAASGAAATRVAKEIEMAWSKSGSAAMDLLLRRGKEALTEGHYPLAIEHLTALTDHAPDFAEGYHARAEAYFRAGLFGPALDDLETTLALNPMHYEAMFGLAVMFQEFGDLRNAARLYRQVLAIYPSHDNAGKALSRLKRDGIGREL